ncbi:deoxynucleoside kinase [Ectothiorhodospira haloalkaliphila]|uniref:deoxynucleoside kinase n=1 Tax=Ectothiorhodospira TaxID=1051 RepID=UPI00047BB699|nr:MULTISPECIES: deoxynucleoside kinase [Ectothiorhodospira]MCG5499048.1 deoxynucleoside kinase [Ectothiorhodospira variabilis]MCG5523973.1 deoxynucleoside kinase [Ectothiorhodospira haloalkaliphila]
MNQTELTEPSLIAVEGPIGVGKTSLATRLADTLGAELVLESPDHNPFLERFYQDPRHQALATQLFFLTQRLDQWQGLRRDAGDAPALRVTDFVLDKDDLFAQVTLEEEEYRLYQRIRQGLQRDVARPDLVIYLQAPVEILRERIAQRGRSYEKLMDSVYLQRLSDTYASFFYHYAEAPLLIVNAGEIDWVKRDEDFQQLLDFMRTIRAGRHYFNPLPSAV